MIPGLASVVICAYNNWPDLEMTIESALHQSYQPLEVIVVDNSSTDVTPQEVPRRFGLSVRYIRQPNRECAGAYNAGFDLARGEFIQFVDGDDVLAPNKIAKQVEVFRASPDLDIVYGDTRDFQTLAGTANWKDVGTQQEDDMLMALLVFENRMVTTGALGTLFRRRALEKVGPWDESLYVEDLDYWLRAAWAGCRFGHCPGSLMGFSRVRPGQKGANACAMNRGMEAVWDKALGYVTREPYRSLIAASLAHLRFLMAVSRDHLTKQEALAKLALARGTHPETVSALAYAVGYAAIVLPGGAALVRSRWPRAIRRGLARLLHYRTPE
jgi:glycosyltransferase involved in cell wall biosynthesis